MKLPTGKKERIQLFVAIGIGAIMVIFVLVRFVIGPVVTSKKEKAQRIVELQEANEKARKETEKTTDVQRANIETLKKILELDKYMLRAQIGNIDIPANDLVEKMIEPAKLKERALNPAGRVTIPAVVSPSGENDAKAYVMRLSTKCSYADAVRLLETIEKSSPYVHVINVDISDIPDNILEHVVQMDIQVPYWTDVTLPERIKAQLKEMEPSAPTEAKQ